MASRGGAFDPWYDRYLDPDSRSFLDGYLDGGDDLFIPSRYLGRYRSPRGIIRPSTWTGESRESGAAEKNLTKELFSVKLDVHHFQPEEVTVKTKDNNLIIEAKHDERQDSEGFISRQFTRRYILPDDVNIENIVVNMSTDGILAVEAPRKSAQPGGERVLPIRQTGRPAAKPVNKDKDKEEVNEPRSPQPQPPQSPSSSQSQEKESSRGQGQTIPIERESK